MNPFYDQLNNTALSLADYLSAVKLTIDEIFNHEVWVQAQLRAVSSKGGHTYFELAETDDNDAVIASCRGTLWRFRAGVIKKFESSTGMPLKAGLSVLIKGQAVFHAQYGFSFNISDIDPNYTLGELTLAYNKMKNKLAENGLLTANKALPLPFDLQKIAVIAPENAAGLGDFRAEADILARCGACAFHYYNATFQGNNAPAEIRQAIGTAFNDFINHFNHLPDILIIIRGGGAVGDLAYLNDYELGAMIGESPVPVWVGIGHERDSTILDEVAHTRFDTPSKVVAGVKEFLANRWGNGKRYFDNIQNSSMRLLNQARYEQNLIVERLQKASFFVLERQKMMLNNDLFAIQKTSERHTLTAKNDIRQLQLQILSHNPADILNKGYVIIKKDNAIINCKEKLNKGDSVQLQFRDGEIGAVIV